MTGRDGKQYAASRPQRKPAEPPPDEKPKGPETAAEWAEFFAKLSAVTEFTQLIRSHKLPKEMESWRLVNVLEDAARRLLVAVKHLRLHPR